MATPEIISLVENINNAAVFPDYFSVSYDYDGALCAEYHNTKEHSISNEQLLWQRTLS